MDVRETCASMKPRPAPAIRANRSDNPGYGTEMGMADYDKMPFSRAWQHINNPIGCANCHEANTMRLIVTNPALEEALEAQGKDWRTFTRQEMRTVVCANCHVEYYFKGGQVPDLPLGERHPHRRISRAYYAEIGFQDWEHPEAGHADDQDAAPGI
jgi:nitrite reductase (cytochrome c-552)